MSVPECVAFLLQGADIIEAVNAESEVTEALVRPGRPGRESKGRAGEIVGDPAQ